MKIQQILDTVVKLDGAAYCMLVDSENGALLAGADAEGEHWPLSIVAERGAGIVRADRHAMQVLGKEEEIAKELLFTMKDYLHVIIVLPKNPQFYICTGFNRNRGNLALVRRVVHDLVANWEFNL